MTKVYLLMKYNGQECPSKWFCYCVFFFVTLLLRAEKLFILTSVVCFLCLVRPHSTDSATHRKMTLSLADRCSKTQKIRILPMAGRDPESHRNEMIKVTHSHSLCRLCCPVCLSSDLSENAFVTTGTKKRSHEASC